MKSPETMASYDPLAEEKPEFSPLPWESGEGSDTEKNQSHGGGRIEDGIVVSDESYQGDTTTAEDGEDTQPMIPPPPPSLDDIQWDSEEDAGDNDDINDFIRPDPPKPPNQNPAPAPAPAPPPRRKKPKHKVNDRRRIYGSRSPQDIINGE